VQVEVVSLGLPVTFREVGFGGLSIESQHEFAVGETHALRCRVSSLPSVVLHVRVMHCRPQATPLEPECYVTGFQFVEEWWPGDHSAVDEFIAQVTNVLSAETDDEEL
jgi:hypothetical protein